MNTAQLLEDGFARVQDLVHSAVEGLTAEQLTYRVDPGANTIAWLVWHLTRVQDDHIAEAAGLDQIWTAQGWAKRFDLALDDKATGYGHSREDVAAVRVETPALLTGYYDAVWDQTRAYLGTLDEQALDRVVDDRWDPPVTLGVRLTSVIGDDLQHAGQAAFLRGIVERR
ncbi:mycothiol transferase [Leekyejoonella antrihumi]|uniref:DUF664 domain-containing protein n=1 Tax=Leekyejoonella antrihumi TaxID=1660198 RepID=A0A563E506_9MICO|nr:DUF664 domain-containing protein [Leekyejoonella antrihumi]TWP36954.1 DUF664 domain-containing protein [Leekyejoonella antrihumi]